MTKRVAVIGAGLSGLSTAIYLERNGLSVTVYEASDRVGGRVTTDIIDGFRCDRGFQVINPNYSEIRRLNALAGIDFAPIFPNIKINGRKFGFSHPINTFQALPNLNREILNPFLKGVFLTDPNEIPKKISNEIKRSFIFGRPGVPVNGVAEFSERLADQVSNIQLNASVDSVKGGKVKGNFGTESFDAVVIATDPATSTLLTGIKEYSQILPSRTWYHATEQAIKDAKYLSIDTSSRLVNTAVISEVSKNYAPKGKHLISSTSLEKMSESEVKRDLAKIWGVNTKSWDLISSYDIKHSLPFRLNVEGLSPKIAANLYLAGDHRDTPSQNGALRSGRRAAQSVISDLKLN
jgi:Flavin containing amine oxidoreductase